jgi:hypothetical protein
MTWELGSEELEAVLGLPAPERYAYFVKRSADREEVWGLRDDRGWVTAEDDEGRVFMPVWPHPEYARACARDEWGNASPASIELHDWVEGWLPDLEHRRHLVSVFPVPAGKGVAVEPGRLRRDLEAEIALYE